MKKLKHGIKFRYKNWQGKSKHTTKRGFKTKKDALNYEHEFKATSEERVNITVAALAEKYFEDIKIHLKASSYITIKNTIEKHFLPYLNKLKLDELTPAIMRQWQNQIMKESFKPNTLRNINRRCSSFLNFAVKFYGLAKNPLSHIGSIGKLESSINFWTSEEFKQFLMVISDIKHRICFSLLFFSGMRVGELMSLNVEDFDFEKNQIRINKNKMRYNGEITTPKTTHSVRIIDMPLSLMQNVKAYIESLNKVESPLFSISYSTLAYEMHRYAKKANLKEIHIHDLRHSHASLLIHSGVPITTISKRLGHKSPKITLEVYSHMYNETAKQVANLLQDYFISVSQNVVRN